MLTSGDDPRNGVGAVTATQTEPRPGPSRRALRITGCVTGAFGAFGGVVMPWPDNALLVIGFGGAGLIMLVRSFTAGRATSRLSGAIMLAIGIAGAAVLYGDNRDLSGAIIWLVGLGGIGTYLVLRARSAPAP
jgi:hypothetical protein